MNSSRRNPLNSVALALAAVLAAAPSLATAEPDASAPSPLTPGVIGPDDRRIAPDVAEWRAVGRLNHGGGFCTATLIAPDRVLTAAHCLFYPRTGRPIPPDRLHFLAGYRQGRFAAHRRGAAVRLHWSFRPPRPRNLSEMAADVAVLTLDAPITEIAPITPSGPAAAVGRALLSVSYARDRAELPSLERDCSVSARRGPLLFTDCDVNFGGSGGPLLRRSADGLRLVAVVSGAVRSGRGARSIAAVPPLDLLDAP